MEKGRRRKVEPQMGIKEGGFFLVFPKDFAGTGINVLGYLIAAYNHGVEEQRNEYRGKERTTIYNRSFDVVGLSLSLRTQGSNTEIVSARDRAAYGAEMTRIEGAFDEFISTHQVIATVESRQTYEHAYMADYLVRSDDGTDAFRQIIISPSIKRKPGGTAQYALDVYARNPQIVTPPDLNADRLLFSMSVDTNPMHPAPPSFGYLKAFGRLLDQVVERGKDTVIRA